MDELFTSFCHWIAKLLVYDPVIFFSGLPSIEDGNAIVAIIRILLMAPVFLIGTIFWFVLCLHPYKWLANVWFDKKEEKD